MSKAQRDKGARREREIVAMHKALGVHAERVGVAYAKGHDVDIFWRGRDYGALVAEIKARASGEGFVTLERWLGENDLLFLVRDRADPLVVIPWRVWQLLLGRLPR